MLPTSTALWRFFALALHSGFVALWTNPFSLFVEAAFFFDHLDFAFFASHISNIAQRGSAGILPAPLSQPTVERKTYHVGTHAGKMPALPRCAKLC